MLLAQVITIAALGKAAWLAFFRPRADGYGHLEPLRPGMLAGLGSLAACCVVFGVLPRFFLDTVMAPAAASLLHPARYAAGVLSGVARLPVLQVPWRPPWWAGDTCGPGSPRRCGCCGASTTARSTTMRPTRSPGSSR